MHKKYFDKIDELNSEYVKIWSDVCNIESPTDFKQGVDAVGDYFVNLAKIHGFKVERFEHKSVGNVVCITMNSDSNKAPLVLSGHMDTVHPVGSFGTPAVKIKEDKIYGPGVKDCKGGIVASFMAMDALYRCGYNARPIMLLLQSDEENGSRKSNKATINYICEKSKNAVAFLNMEGYIEGECCIARKGIITYKFAISGIAAHSSSTATKGANAIAEAAHKILEIEKFKDPEGITCCCSIISGGTAPNTVPDFCKLKVNVRFSDQKQFELIESEMHKIADTVYIKGCKTELSTVSYRICMEYKEKNEELLSTANRAFKSCGLTELKPVKKRGGSDAADVTAYGTPCIDSLGVSGENIHTTEEFAYIPSMSEAAKRVVAVALYL